MITRNVKVEFGLNFVRLEFDPEIKHQVVKLVRETTMKVKNRTAWWEFDPSDRLKVLKTLRRCGFHLSPRVRTI